MKKTIKTLKSKNSETDYRSDNHPIKISLNFSPWKLQFPIGETSVSYKGNCSFLIQELQFLLTGTGISVKRHFCENSKEQKYPLKGT